MVHADMANVGVSNGLGVHVAVAVGSAADSDDAFGNQRLHLAEMTDDGDFLFVSAGFGEHAQIEHCSSSALVLDDHECVVNDVGSLAVVPLIKMIHILCTAGHDTNRAVVNEEIHEIEEVTALLDKCSTGVAIESVPVAHLHEKRKAMLTDRDHLHLADGSSPNFSKDSLGRGHEAVFETHPNDASGNVGGFGSIDHVPTVLNRCAQRFFYEDMNTCIEYIEQHIMVRVVR